MTASGGGTVWVKVVRRTVGALFLAICAYVATALALGIVAINRGFREVDPEVMIYVRSNGVHTDVVLPVRSEKHDWLGEFARPAWAATAPFIAFGWGDRRFYMETPHWRDLRPDVAFAALFGLGASVMRVDFAGPPRAASGDVAVRLSSIDYAKLIDRIRASFKRGEGGAVIGVPFQEGVGVPFFFEAVGHYSLLATCNDWTRAVLAAAGIRTPVWSPFPAAIFYQLERIPRLTT